MSLDKELASDFPTAEDDTFKAALDSVSSVTSAILQKNNDSSPVDDFDDCDQAQITDLFCKCLADYRRVIKACIRDGIEVENDTQEIKEEYVTSSSFQKRLEIIASIQEQIISMAEACDNPPRGVVSKYSEDLVSRIENGIIIDDGFEVYDE